MNNTNALGFRASEVEYIGDIEIVFYSNGIKTGSMFSKSPENAECIVNFTQATCDLKGYKLEVARGTMQWHLFTTA